MKAPFLIGRLIFGGFFLYNGIHHLTKKKEIAQFTASKNVPMPELAVTATGAMLLAGGASIVLGIKPKLGTLAIMGFLAGVTPVMHNFWDAQDPAHRQADMIHFAKNVALLGAALSLMGVDEPWPVSVPTGQRDRWEPVRRFAREVAA